MVFNKPHKLIQDNEPVSASILTRMLATEYRVQRAQDTNHVLKAARRTGRIPDLILLDVKPPLREGLALCQQLKVDEMTQSVPIEDMNIPHATRDSQRVTINVGCASACPTQNQTYHRLLQTADDQLYAAKKAGRNGVSAEKMAS